MKKLLLGSAVLTALSLSIIAFQFSCVKSASAQVNGTSNSSQLNKILYVIGNPVTTGAAEYWIANYDGSNPQKIPLTITPNYNNRYSTDPKLSPDGKIIFFTVGPNLCSCNIDGTNFKTIITDTSTVNSTSSITLGGAY